MHNKFCVPKKTFAVILILLGALVLVGFTNMIVSNKLSTNSRASGIVLPTPEITCPVGKVILRPLMPDGIGRDGAKPAYCGSPGEIKLSLQQYPSNPKGPSVPAQMTTVKLTNGQNISLISDLAYFQIISNIDFNEYNYTSLNSTSTGFVSIQPNVFTKKFCKFLMQENVFECDFSSVEPGNTEYSLGFEAVQNGQKDALGRILFSAYINPGSCRLSRKIICPTGKACIGTTCQNIEITREFLFGTVFPFLEPRIQASITGGTISLPNRILYIDIATNLTKQARTKYVNLIGPAYTATVYCNYGDIHKKADWWGDYVFSCSFPEVGIVSKAVDITGAIDVDGVSVVIPMKTVVLNFK